MKKAALNWGPLNKLILDKDVHEIIIDRADDSLFATRKGVQKGPKLKQIDLNKLASSLMKLSPDPKSLSCSLSIDNLLISVILPPIAPEGPFIRIAKVPEENFGLERMVEWKAMSSSQMEYLRNLLKTDQSILLAGKAGSGKTTFLNSMLNELPDAYHLVTIEQYGDLKIKRPRTLRLTAPHHTEKEMVDLVKLAGDSRGDYMALAYGQGAEIYPFIELIREGFSGIMCMAGENLFETLKRIEYKISANAPWMTLEDIRYSITQAFGHAVFVGKDTANKRVVQNLVKLNYVDGEIKVDPIK